MIQAVPFFNANDSSIAHNPAFISKAGELSYAKFFESVLRAEMCLRSLGIKNNDRIGICAPNSIDYMATLFALWRIGSIACLFDTRLPEKALSTQLRSLQCTCLLTTVPEFLKSSGITLAKFDIRNVGAGPARETTDISFPMEQKCTIIFTSGRSSEPKAVLHTIGNHYFSALGANEHLPVVPGDQWLLSLPLSHVCGLGILFRTLLGRATVVIPKDSESIEEDIKNFKISHISLVPTQLIRLLENPECLEKLKGFKVILLGGGAVPSSLIRESINLGLPIYTTYGLTEMASQVATSGRLTPHASVSEGKILNYRQLMISESGEIFVKGKTLFSGYIKGRETLQPFQRSGYFATGDIGEFSPSGRLLVKGRKDRI